MHSLLWSYQNGDSYQLSGGLPQRPEGTQKFGGHSKFWKMQGSGSAPLVLSKCSKHRAKHWNICQTLLCVSGGFRLPKFLPDLEICLFLPWMVLWHLWNWFYHLYETIEIKLPSKGCSQVAHFPMAHTIFSWRFASRTIVIAFYSSQIKFLLGFDPSNFLPADPHHIPVVLWHSSPFFQRWWATFLLSWVLAKFPCSSRLISFPNSSSFGPWGCSCTCRILLMENFYPSCSPLPFSTASPGTVIPKRLEFDPRKSRVEVLLALLLILRESKLHHSVQDILQPSHLPPALLWVPSLVSSLPAVPGNSLPGPSCPIFLLQRCISSRNLVN